MSIDITALAGRKLTVVLAYDDGEERDLRLLPGIAQVIEGKLMLLPFVEVAKFPVPEECYPAISPVTPEMGDMLGDAEFYVMLPVPAMPDDEDEDKITVQCITFD